jgi:phosphomethylpyrimidine synthase
MKDKKTLIEKAKNRNYTSLMKEIAKKEQVSPEYIRENISKGSIVIPKNRRRKIKNTCGIGKGLTTKVNANVGTSPHRMNIKNELKKVKESLKAGADTIMDLSCGANPSIIRKVMLKESEVPLGTVPVYEAVVEGMKKYKELRKIDKELFFEVIERQARDGVDFMTIHAGVTLEALSKLRRQKRITGIVSRGGGFIAEWMIGQKKENPFYTGFDRLLEIAARFEVTLSLGDGLRPGAIGDATDQAQVQELITLGELAMAARKKGVQVIIEGPGHLPLDQIEANVKMQKKICRGAPFYVLGPLVTDIAPGYDHLVSAIGGSLAGFYGADFLCFVTPSEHLRLPNLQDIREGVIASRIAAHAADIAKGLKRALRLDREMSKHRYRRNWKGQAPFAIDPEKLRTMRSKEKNTDLCTMCGPYCPMKRMEEVIEKI